MSLSVTAQPDTQLTGRRLVVARGMSIALLALAMGLFIFTIPFQLTYYHIVCSGAACPGDQVSPVGLEQLRQAGLSLGFYATYFTALNVMLVSVFLIVAAIIFWRKSNGWMGIFTSLALALFGTSFNSSIFALVGKQYPALSLLGQLLAFLGVASFFIFFYLFPNGRFVPRWIVWLAPFIVVKEALAAFRPELFPFDWFLLVEVVSVIFAQIHRYRRVSNAVQRQQTKWVVFGAAIGGSGFLIVLLYSNIVFPGGNPSTAAGDLIVNTSYDFFLILIPLSIGIAILRSRLWDIDILIRRTLVYGALTGLLALVYLGAVIALQTIIAVVTGSARSELVTVLSTLVIAALFVPLRRRVQAFIDRRFYRRKYDAARTLAQFGAGLRDEVDLENLSAHLLAAVDETMQPESVALWLRAAGSTGQPK
jgi:hypothetical protein